MSNFKPSLRAAFHDYPENCGLAEAAQKELMIPDEGRRITILTNKEAAFWIGELVAPELPIIVGIAGSDPTMRHDSVWYFGTESPDVLAISESDELQERVLDSAIYPSPNALETLQMLQTFVHRSRYTAGKR